MLKFYINNQFRHIDAIVELLHRYVPDGGPLPSVVLILKYTEYIKLHFICDDLSFRHTLIILRIISYINKLGDNQRQQLNTL